MPTKGRKRAREPEKGAGNRPKKYRAWTDESMTGAMKAVHEGMGVNRAALEYGVPRTTLKDRISERVRHGTKSGPAPYLTPEEEQELREFLETSARIGYPKTRIEVLGIVRKTLEKKGANLDHFNGKGWWIRFRERWPKLSLRKGDALGQPRAQAANAANMNAYYNLLGATLQEHGLKDRPACIYNMDESGVPLDHKPPKVIAIKGTKKVHCRTSGNKAQITIIACANATGSIIPPMVIFEGQRLNPEWTTGEVPGTLYGMSERGWTDQELFFHWMSELFIPNIPPTRPVLLLVDGHSSHYEPDTIRMPAEEGIVIFCLPPHTTHLSQPLDVSFFGPLKRYWSSACHTYMQENPGRVVTKFTFSRLFAEAWYKATSPTNLISGFRKAGIYPFNPDKMEVLLPLPTTAASSSDQPADTSEEDLSLAADGDCTLQAMSFTAEEIELFERRLENGYDLYTDEKYVSWLLDNHKDAIPAEVLAQLRVKRSGLLPRPAGENTASLEDCFIREVGSDDEQGDVILPEPNASHHTCIPHENETSNSEEGAPDKRGDLSTDDKCQADGEVELVVHGGNGSSDALVGSTSVPSSASPLPTPQSVSSTSATPEQPLSVSTSSPSSVSPLRTPVSVSTSPTPLSVSTSSPSSVSPLPTSRSVSSTSSTPRKPLTVISQFLTYPNPGSTPKTSRKSSKGGSGPRVLTSSQAIAMMEEKKKQKEEEILAKEKRKKEREERKIAKEAENKRKAAERERRQLERTKKAEEKEAEKRRKAELRAQKISNKENRPTSDRNRKSPGDNNGLQHTEVGNNECAVCIGAYEDDVIDGELQ